MRELFDQVAGECSRRTTSLYSTSFSLASSLLAPKIREGIYAIYGFVRFADEIVDTLHEFKKETLLQEFQHEAHKAIDRKISLNPILHNFQRCVHQYGIEPSLIEAFFQSMEWDLYRQEYDEEGFQRYVYGSAEVVGLMCLRVFSQGDTALYERCKSSARALGAAFQKVNFLRDLQYDYESLGRTYFPKINPRKFSLLEKKQIESEIERDFSQALSGIRELPVGVRLGVHAAYTYYYSLFNKLRSLPPERIANERIRVPNAKKLLLLARSWYQCYVGGI